VYVTPQVRGAPLNGMSNRTASARSPRDSRSSQPQAHWKSARGTISSRQSLFLFAIVASEKFLERGSGKDATSLTEDGRLLLAAVLYRELIVELDESRAVRNLILGETEFLPPEAVNALRDDGVSEHEVFAGGSIRALVLERLKDRSPRITASANGTTG
jgi:hypothetical protein